MDGFNGLTEEQAKDIVVLTNDYSCLMVVLTEYTKAYTDDKLVLGFDKKVVDELYLRVFVNLGQLVDSDVSFFELSSSERKQLKLACKVFAGIISRGELNPVPGTSIGETLKLIESFKVII